ncbi:MAG: Fe-S cluster assembly ATPase SufC [Nitrospirota bacterium]
MLEIKNLHAEVDGKGILKGISLSIAPGEIHAIMGPNGSGKSTLSYVLSGSDGYEVTGGEVLFNGENLLEMEPEERAAAGIFLAFQYPVEIPGVPNSTFLKEAVNALRKTRGEPGLDAMQFMKLLRAKTKELGMKEEMLKRSVNTGFSGGEKKRNEMLQMAMLEPSLAILDETDSGLDIDALKAVADGVNAMRSPERSMLVITHYQRLLDYIVPDHVHVLAGGKIVRSGGKELAAELEAKGYGEFTESAA